MQNYNSKFKNNFKILIFFIAILIFTFSIFNFAQAALVPCGPGTEAGECNFCHLVTLINRVINFALYNIAIPLVAIMIIWGGFVIMTAGDSSDKAGEGRKIIQAAAIGLVVALGAWVIVNAILIAVGIAGDKTSLFKPWKWGDVEFCPGTLK